MSAYHSTPLDLVPVLLILTKTKSPSAKGYPLAGLSSISKMWF
jgi:hypothetical protein